MKEQNKVRMNGTNREIAKQIDNKMKHTGKQTRHHQKKRNALRKNLTRKSGLQRERMGQNEKEREETRWNKTNQEMTIQN